MSDRAKKFGVNQPAIFYALKRMNFDFNLDVLKRFVAYKCPGDKSLFRFRSLRANFPNFWRKNFFSGNSENLLTYNVGLFFSYAKKQSNDISDENHIFFI